MEPGNALNVIKQLESYISARELDLFIVGSVAYSGALNEHAKFLQCDDLDYVIIYRNIKQLQDYPFFRRPGLYSIAWQDLHNGAIDLFSCKTEISGIRISADFISAGYFRTLAMQPTVTKDSYRIKLTDSVEKPDNEYRSFSGKSLTYIKPFQLERGFFYYTLPVFLCRQNDYFTGALYNKFIHNPYPVIASSEIRGIHDNLLYNYSRFYNIIKKNHPNADIFRAMLFRERFSEQTYNYIERIKNLYLNEK